MGAAAEISRSRNQPNSFDREIEKATLRAGAAFSVESEGAIGINLPPIARVAAEFNVISAGELPNTQLNRQQLKCLIRYKLAAVSDIELKKEMYWVSTTRACQLPDSKNLPGSSKRRVKLTAASAIADLDIGKQEMQSQQYFQRSRTSQSPAFANINGRSRSAF